LITPDSFIVGGQQVDHLDAGLEHLGLGAELFKLGGRAVDGVALFGGHGAHFVNRIAQHVHDAPQGLFAHGHRDGRARVFGVHAARQAVGRAHGHGAHGVVAQVLLHLERQVNVDLLAAHLVFARDLEGVVDGRQLAGRELDVHHGADD
jgi:peptide chain release factor 1